MKEKIKKIDRGILMIGALEISLIALAIFTGAKDASKKIFKEEVKIELDSEESIELEEEPEYINIYDYRTLTLTDEEIANIQELLYEELKYEETVIIDEDDKAEDYLLLYAILENEKLEESYKSYFYNMLDLIAENPYLDKEHSYESLIKLETKDCEREENVSNLTIAAYASYSNTIKFYSNKNFRHSMFHEAIHAIIDIKYFKIPKFFLEGVTELLYKEYFSNDPYGDENAYSYQMYAVKYICELVGKDKVLEAYSTNDMNIVYEALAEITGTKEEARQELEFLDNLISDRKNDERIIYKDINIEWHLNKLDNYRVKYLEKHIGDNLKAANLYYNFEMLNVIFSDMPVNADISVANRTKEIIDSTGVMEKAYFSTKLREDSANFFVPYKERLRYQDRIIGIKEEQNEKTLTKK